MMDDYNSPRNESRRRRASSWEPDQNGSTTYEPYEDAATGKISLPVNWSDWEVMGELGRGSFSVVYEAVRKDDPDIRCAIKQITIPQDNSEIEGDNTLQSKAFLEEAIRDFTREVRLMEHFKGIQNIVSIEDYKVIPKEDGIGSYIFIRMELLKPLDKYLSDKTLSEEEALQVGVDICTALEFCQENRIIHRDIKPANIFVNDRIGGHVFYKLGDFGIARNLAGKTVDLSTKGTPNYMAPEVASFLPYDSRADIYSLGLTLYWLMNGKRLPFYPQTQLYSRAAQDAAVARRLAGEALPMPINAGEETGRIILKACAFRREDRYATATDMKQDLLALLHKFNKESVHEENSDKESVSEEKIQKISLSSEAGNTKKTKKTAKNKIRILGTMAAVFLLLFGGWKIYDVISRGNERERMNGAESAHPSESVAYVPEETPAENSGNHSEKPETAEESREDMETGETEKKGPMADAEASSTEDSSTEEFSSPYGEAVTALLQGLEEKKATLLEWKKMAAPDEIVIPDQWDQLPLQLPLEQAPEMKAGREGDLLSISAPEGYEGMALTLQIQGSEPEGKPDETGRTWVFELPEGLASSMTLKADFEAAGLQGGYTYMASTSGEKEDVAFSCVSSSVIALEGEEEYEAVITQETDNSWKMNTEIGKITAYYLNNSLIQYEDAEMGCVYDSQGYIINGEPKQKISPVIFFSDASSGERNRQHELLKKMQAAEKRCQEIIEYNQKGHLFVPEKWDEMNMPGFLLSDAPKVLCQNVEGEMQIAVPDRESLWQVTGKDDTGFQLTLSGPESMECVLNYTFMGEAAVCTKVQVTCDVWYTWGNMSGSVTVLYLGQQKEETAENTINIYRFDFPGESMSLQAAYSTKTNLDGDSLISATIGTSQGKQTIERNQRERSTVLCAVTDKGELLPVSGRTDIIPGEIAGYFDPWSASFTGTENAFLSVKDAIPVENFNGRESPYAVREIRNISDDTLTLAGVSASSGDSRFAVTAGNENEVNVICIPATVAPGEYAYLFYNPEESSALISYVKDPLRLAAGAKAGKESLSGMLSESSSGSEDWLWSVQWRNDLYDSYSTSILIDWNRRNEISWVTYGVHPDFEFEILEDGTAKLIGYWGTAEEIKVPARLEGYPVGTIGANCFDHGESLRSVELPETVTVIENFAFLDCNRLERILLPESVREIGTDEVFSRCPSLKEIVVDEGNKIYSSIDGVLFNQAEHILVAYPAGKTGFSYTVPRDVREICDYAFMDCENLTRISMPKGLLKIGVNAFAGCRHLVSAPVPETVIWIGEYAYSGTAISEVVIPEGVTVVQGGTFMGCYELKQVTLPKKLVSIEHNAFAECPISEISFPDTLRSIGAGAFLHGSLKQELHLPSQLETIGSSAFESNSALTSVEIPESVYSIEENPFGYCNKLQITVSQGNTRFRSDHGVLIDETEHRLVCYPMYLTDASYQVPEDITEITPEAFMGNQFLSEIILPESLMKIGYNAFAGCSDLRQISIPDGVLEIGSSAFSSCEHLVSVHLPEKLSKLEGFMFALCTNLSRVNIPERVEEIGQVAFQDCSALTYLYLPAGVKYIWGEAFRGCTNLVIYADAGSYAEQYAISNGIPYSTDVETFNKENASVFDGTEEEPDSNRTEDEEGKQSSITEESVPDWLIDEKKEEPGDSKEKENEASADNPAQPTEEPVPDWLIDEKKEEPDVSIEKENEVSADNPAQPTEEPFPDWLLDDPE